MKPRYVSLLLCVIVLAVSIPAHAVPPEWPHPFEMEFPPVDVNPIEPVQITLDNGMVIFLLEDRSLPLIDGVVVFRAGSNYDPAEQRGLAQLTALLTREGGAGERTGDEVDRTLEHLAASVELSAAGPFAMANFSSLTHNVDQVLGILADMLLDPRLDAERLEILRGRMLESIRRQNDQPVNLAVQEFLYRVTSGHPSTAYPTVTSVQSLTRQGVVDFHDRYFRPDQTVMAISGDFDTDEMAELLQKTFAQWEPSDQELPQLPPLDMEPDPVIYHIQRDLAQSVVLVGHPVLTFDDPDFMRLNVLNRILGGAGDNRLFTEIRTRRGYAYSVGSQVTEGYEYPGIFFAFSISRADKTGEVISLLLDEIDAVLNEPVTEVELERNRSALSNSAVFRYASMRDVARRSALVHFLGVDPDYYDHQMEIVQSLTVDELLATAQRHLRPAESVIMVVGNANSFDRSLEEFGTVVEIEF